MSGFVPGLGAWLALLALICAPVIVSLTHSPAAAMATEVETRHGHAHGETRESLSVGGHDASDHEHQVTALSIRPARIGAPVLAGFERGGGQVASSAIREGPRRPPRKL